MLEKVEEIIKSYITLDKSRITKDDHLIGDLGLNSFDIVNIVVEIEDAFNIEISDRDIRTLSTVGDVICYLESSIQ